MQFCDEVAEPAQLAPPLATDGLLHERVSVWVPVPQLLEQAAYE